MKTASTSSKLGVIQAQVLRSLIEGGWNRKPEWSPVSGWVWTSVFATKKYMDGLVKKGMVQVRMVKNEGYSCIGPEYPVYTPTEVGLAWVKANPR
jgi:hypothetical protein